MFELQHAPSSGSEAEGEASENPEVQAKPSPEGEDPENSASQSESLSENEMDQQQMEALFSDNGHVVALRNFKKKSEIASLPLSYSRGITSNHHAGFWWMSMRLDSFQGRLARLTAIQQISSGRHEFLQLGQSSQPKPWAGPFGLS